MVRRSFRFEGLAALAMALALVLQAGCPDTSAGSDVRPDAGPDGVANDVPVADTPVDAPDPAGPDTPAEDLAPEAASDLAADPACTCGTATTCCDGCLPKNDDRKCAPEGGTWGICRAGACEAIPGTIDELAPADGPGIQSVVFGADGARLAVTHGDATSGTGRVALWDLAARSETWRQEGPVQGAAFRPGDPTVLAVGSTPVILRTVADGSPSGTFDGLTGPVAWSPDGTRLAASTEAAVKVVDPADGSVQATLDHPEEQKAHRWSLAWSPDGTRLASATGQNGFGSPHGDVRLFFVDGSAAPVVLECTSMGARFSPDGTRLATACWNNLTIWDGTTGALVAQRWAQDSILAADWSPDGTRLAVGTFAGGLEILGVDDLEGGEPLGRIPMAQVKGVAWSPDGTRIAFGSSLKATAYVWTLPPR